MPQADRVYPQVWAPWGVRAEAARLGTPLVDPCGIACRRTQPSECSW
ncbi:hypothetical protein [Mycobacterium gordonae]|nr:hypothetical protein [Mycobacterium gordonae]